MASIRRLPGFAVRSRPIVRRNTHWGAAEVTTRLNPQDHYACWHCLGSQDRYLLWFYGGPPTWDDGVALADDGRVPAFGSVEEVADFARARGVDLGEGGMIETSHDLDAVAAWLEHPSAEEVDCDTLLSAWNLFADVAVSVGADLDPWADATIGVYLKLFWGNNLPAMTPPGECYVPEWDADEVGQIAEVLGEGLRVSRAAVHPVEGEGRS
jgi:hypothetical protein